MEDRKLTVKDSQKLARSILNILAEIYGIDEEYLKLVTKEMKTQAQYQESAVVLMASHTQLKKNELLYAQVGALEILANYIEKLKQIDELKVELSKQEVAQDDLMKLFM